MCSLKLSCELRYPPRYLTVEHLSIVSLMTLVVFSLHFESGCLVPKYMNSVLDLFSFSLICIHPCLDIFKGRFKEFSGVPFLTGSWFKLFAYGVVICKSIKGEIFFDDLLDCRGICYEDESSLNRSLGYA